MKVGYLDCYRRLNILVLQLKQRIQAAFDRSGSGVEVVGILIPVLRPPAGEPAGMFEELSIDIQNQGAIYKRFSNLRLQNYLQAHSNLKCEALMLKL